MTSPEVLAENSVLYKYGAAGSRLFDTSGGDSYSIGADGKTVYMYITDGGLNDEDGIADGIIEDPVGVAEPKSETEPTPDSSGSSGGGCCATRTGSAYPSLFMLSAYMLYTYRRRRAK